MTQSEPTDFLKANAAALRALAGGVDRQVRYAGQDTHIGKTEIRLPALPRETGQKMRSDSRGAADSAGLWLAHHNDKTHQSLCPSAPAAKAIFEKSLRLNTYFVIALLNGSFVFGRVVSILHDGMPDQLLWTIFVVDFTVFILAAWRYNALR